jgi:hypothetical protein
MTDSSSAGQPQKQFVGFLCLPLRPATYAGSSAAVVVCIGVVVVVEGVRVGVGVVPTVKGMYGSFPMNLLI